MQVLEGTMTEDEVLMEFLDTLGDGSAAGNGDGRIELKEFEEYYANVGASIDNDDYFFLMMKNAWKLGDQVLLSCIFECCCVMCCCCAIIPMLLLCDDPHSSTRTNEVTALVTAGQRGSPTSQQSTATVRCRTRLRPWPHTICIRD